MFLTEEKPRTYLYNIFILANQEGKDPYKYVPDFKFDMKLEKKKNMNFLKTQTFKEKLGKRILDVLKCECVNYKGFQYIPANIRNILKSFTFHSSRMGFMYDICRLQTEGDTDEIEVIPLFLDIALCCLYEKDYEEFVNIAASIGAKLNLGRYLINHIDTVNYTDAKKYRVNIDMKCLDCKLYLKAGKKDNTIKKHNKYSHFGMDEKCTDFESISI